MTKSNFLHNSQPIAITVAGQSLVAKPKQFSTGSVGFFVNGKVPIALPGGQTVVLQVSGNCTAIGSKEWLRAAHPAHDDGMGTQPAVTVTIARHGRRNWAVYLNGELLAVTVYRKGAFAVRDVLQCCSPPPPPLALAA